MISPDNIPKELFSQLFIKKVPGQEILLTAHSTSVGTIEKSNISFLGHFWIWVGSHSACIENVAKVFDKFLAVTNDPKVLAFKLTSGKTKEEIVCFVENLESFNEKVAEHNKNLSPFSFREHASLINTDLIKALKLVIIEGPKPATSPQQMDGNGQKDEKPKTDKKEVRSFWNFNWRSDNDEPPPPPPKFSEDFPKWPVGVPTTIQTFTAPTSAPPPRLFNRGNTCHFAAALNFLSSLPPVMDVFNNTPSRNTAADDFAHNFLIFLKAQATSTLEEDKSVYSKEDYDSLLYQYQNFLVKAGTIRDIHHQQDATEDLEQMFKICGVESLNKESSYKALPNPRVAALVAETEIILSDYRVIPCDKPNEPVEIEGYTESDFPLTPANLLEKENLNQDDLPGGNKRKVIKYKQNKTIEPQHINRLEVSAIEVVAPPKPVASFKAANSEEEAEETFVQSLITMVVNSINSTNSTLKEIFTSESEAPVEVPNTEPAAASTINEAPVPPPPPTVPTIPAEEVWGNFFVHGSKDRDFTKDVRLKGTNKCFRIIKAARAVSRKMVNAPEVLLYQYSRSVIEGFDSSHQPITKKINDPIETPLTLNFPAESFVGGVPSNTSIREYVLCATINHIGGASGGHYVALQNRHGKWYRNDDLSAGVTPISENNLQSLVNLGLVFGYVRKDIYEQMLQVKADEDVDGVIVNHPAVGTSGKKSSDKLEEKEEKKQ